MNYKCSGCNYTSDIKQRISRHQKSKNLKCVDSFIIEEKISIICEYCNKSFSVKKSLQRHYKTCKKNTDIISAEVKQLREEVNQMKNNNKGDIVNTITNNTTNNVTINVQLNGYRDSSINHIDNRHFENIVKKMTYMIPDIVQLVHFNEKVPENHNICIKNINGKYALVYNGEKWIKMSKTDVINDLIIIHEMNIRNWVEDEVNPELLKEYERYEYEKEKSTEMISRIKEEIGLVLYNNRDVIKSIKDI